MYNRYKIMDGKFTFGFTTVVFSVQCYVFMEWLFFVTKPSFMDYINAREKIAILFQASFLMYLYAFSFFLVLSVINAGLEKVLHPSIQILLFPASLICSLLGLMLVDNFTYTIFQAGIISSTNLTRLIYVILFCFFLYYFYRELSHFFRLKKNVKIQRQLFYISLWVFGASFIFFVIQQFQGTTWQDNSLSVLDNTRKPNIIILGTDGLDAAHMSMYGYNRKTTPVIDELAKESLVAENHFSNSYYTIGSLVSTLTSTLPIETRVLSFADILNGEDAYQHLAHILKSEGYYNVQWGNAVQVNAEKWNMLSGFDMVNGEKAQQHQYLAIQIFFGGDANYFISEIKGRLTDRLFHIFYIKDMEKPLSLDDLTEKAMISDRVKVSEIINLIKNSNGPFFVHAHLMDTHGDKFTVRKHVFSAGKTDNKNWNPDFMDDSILQYDQYVGRILDALKKYGKINNTIFIIYTDHGSEWTAKKKIPLIIYFPGGEHAGKIRENTQNLDVVPTLLDYMNLPQPAWAHGNSLLRNIDPHRLIFSFDRSKLKERTKPPFFQFGAVQVTECQKWYVLNLKTGEFTSGDISQHTAPCEIKDMYSMNEVRDAIINLLIANGYNVPIGF